MESPVDSLPAKRTASTGTSSEKVCKKLRLSSGNLPHSHVNVVDYKNPHAISDVIDCSESRKFGSVTKDIEALLTQRMQILGAYLPKYPRLANQLLKVVTDHDEEKQNSESKKVTGMSYQNVIDLDLERGHIEKDVLTPRREKDVYAAPTVVIIDSDEEDDRDQKCFLPFQKVVLPKPVESPALKMIGYHAPIACHEESAILKYETSPHPQDNTQKDKCVYVGAHEEEDAKVDAETSLTPKDNTRKRKGVYVDVHKEEDNKVYAETSLPPKDNPRKEEGVYVGVHEEGENKVDAEDEKLEDIWREMLMAIETSK